MLNPGDHRPSPVQSMMISSFKACRYPTAALNTQVRGTDGKCVSPLPWVVLWPCIMHWYPDVNNSGSFAARDRNSFAFPGHTQTVTFDSIHSCRRQSPRNNVIDFHACRSGLSGCGLVLAFEAAYGSKVYKLVDSSYNLHSIQAPLSFAVPDTDTSSPVPHLSSQTNVFRDIHRRSQCCCMSSILSLFLLGISRSTEHCRPSSMAFLLSDLPLSI